MKLGVDKTSLTARAKNFNLKIVHHLQVLV